MTGVVINKKVSFHWSVDRINTYHSALFHGTVINKTVDDNNLGDALEIPLQLEKNAYDSCHIIKPNRNLVVPESAKQRLVGVQNISFFKVVFAKLFFVAFKEGDRSVGPEDFREFDLWLASFPHQEGLRHETENFYELVVPAHVRLLQEFKEVRAVGFTLKPGRASELALSEDMLLKYPVIWTTEGIVFRDDVYRLIEDFFRWDYFYRGPFTLAR